jgi:hypothetical protein
MATRGAMMVILPVPEKNLKGDGKSRIREGRYGVKC